MYHWLLVDVFQVESIDDQVKECLQRIKSLDLNAVTDQQKAEYKKRKLITEV